MKHSKQRSQSKKLSEALKKAGVKRLNVPSGSNRLNNQLFASLTGAAPIYFSDNAETYIRDGYEFNPDVYAVVNGITNAASAVPAVVYEVKNKDKARKYYRLKYSQRNGAEDGFLEKSKQLKEQAFEEAPDSDLADVIDRPNPLQAWPEFVENTIGFKLVTGNSFTHGVELSDGRFGELWPMPPQFTQIKASKSTETLIEGYTLNTYGTTETIDAETVMHLKYWNPNYSSPGSHLYGMSPLKAARRSVRAGNDGKTALSRAYANNGASGMLFPKDPDITGISKEQRNQIKQYQRQHGAGPENYKSFLVFSAEMGFQQFGMPPVDLEILEAGKMSMRDICNVYSYPSELLNDPDNKTNTNKRESRKQLYQEVVIPTLERFYSELNRWLVPRFEEVAGKEYHIDYDVSQVEALRQDQAKKVEWLSKVWPLPPNVFLQEMGFDPIDDPRFDEPWVDMGKLPVSEMLMDGTMTEEQAKLLELEYMNGN